MYYLGLDLGQAQDYSALVVLEQRWHEHPDHPGELQTDYVCGYLKRWQVKTPYRVVVEDCRQVLLRPRINNAILAVDHTGVGRAVYELFLQAGLSAPRPLGQAGSQVTSSHLGSLARSGAALRPIVFTAGHDVTWGDDGSLRVPKKEMVGAVQVLLQNRRLAIAEVECRDLLVKELEVFKAKITAATGHESFECLTAGTLIKTRTGEKPIECVNRDDDVLTRNGYNRVLWAGETKRVFDICRVEFDNGKAIEGTADHLVFTLNRGWVELGSLTCQDQCIRLSETDVEAKIPRLSSSTELNTGGRHRTATSSESIPKTLSTVPSGNSIEVPFRTGTTFTTRTRTLATTPLETLSALQMLSMRPSISRGIVLKRGNARLATSDLLAAGAGREGIRTLAFVSVPFPVPNPHVQRGLLCAFSANGLLPDVFTRPFASVQRFAGRLFGTLIAADRRNASGVVASFQPSTRFPSIVRPVAPPFIVSRRCGVPVFDLVVQGEHEFFANGILVHNSWRERDHDDIVFALAMACWLGERMGRQDSGPIMMPRGDSSMREKGEFAVLRRGRNEANAARRGLDGRTSGSGDGFRVV
jgi:hypothetical protein